MWRNLMMIWLWTALFPLTLAAGVVDEAALKHRYDAMASFKADIQQTKKAPYLLKPLVSKVQLDVTKERILWHILEPKPLTVKMAGSSLTFLDQNGLPIQGSNMALDQKRSSFVQVLNALFTGDINALKKLFEVTYEGSQVVLVSREPAGVLRKVTFWFAPDLVPQRMELVLGNESLLFEFSNCVVN